MENLSVLPENFRQLVGVEPERAFHRNFYTPGHLTASAFILNQSHDKILLTLHRKLGKWMQLGGHLEGEKDLLAGALREAVEESGLKEFKVLVPEPFDCDVHGIPARPQAQPPEPAHDHYDVRFLIASAEPEENILISDESSDLKWFSLDEALKLTQNEESMQRPLKKIMAWRTHA